ncbi:response regulator transcription factor [Desulfosporosinus youngiae]|uniref:Stage 0 sporulation protein A homolog n=1 Tax=Desulfosporosinus youngiae DSM 17734 TaxID=768710 RepID=H5XW89_9FIRM|nr:response regulator transcription factor [Desulfosporosinus youngiae]EHQ90682.1 response regulator with CheY-like receiver domain and winged-helix DNA-binding domain [Desulfosporosinus youngiae DSM 17734]
MNTILLIEDNEQLQKYISEYLEVYGFTTRILDDYDAVPETIAACRPKLILLDINLPKFDGFYYLKLIRKHYKIPIIIISARSEEGEQIRGIENGADDYITKPFSIGVLLAKINAMLRREAELHKRVISLDGLCLNEDTLSVAYKGAGTELSKNEYRVLRLLMKNAGQIVSREQLLEELWDDVSFVDDNTLTVNITRVKKKLMELGLQNCLETKRGVGYAFNTAALPNH